MYPITWSSGDAPCSSYEYVVAAADQCDPLGRDWCSHSTTTVASIADGFQHSCLLSTSSDGHHSRKTVMGCMSSFMFQTRAVSLWFRVSVSTSRNSRFYFCGCTASNTQSRCALVGRFPDDVEMLDNGPSTNDKQNKPSNLGLAIIQSEGYECNQQRRPPHTRLERAIFWVPCRALVDKCSLRSSIRSQLASIRQTTVVPTSRLFFCKIVSIGLYGCLLLGWAPGQVDAWNWFFLQLLCAGAQMVGSLARAS